jgi:hypothetical protein
MELPAAPVRIVVRLIRLLPARLLHRIQPTLGFSNDLQASATNAPYFDTSRARKNRNLQAPLAAMQRKVRPGRLVDRAH